MKRIKLLTPLLILLSQFICFDVSAKSSKEIWLEYNGTESCEKSYCADGISANILKEALSFFKLNQNIITNKDYLTIIDFTKLSTEKRMFILNMKTGSVQKILVTHGKKTEGNKGEAKYFSNIPESEMSSLGFYITDSAPYVGKHGDSIRLDGLSETNSNARKRNIVLHGAEYANQWFIDERGRLGLSQGCPAISPDLIVKVISKLQGGSLIYIYSNLPSL